MGEMFPSEEGGCSQHTASLPWGHVPTGHSGLTASRLAIPRGSAWSAAALTQESRLVFGFLEPTPNTHGWGSGRGPTLTHTCPHVRWGTAIWVLCPPPTGFLFSTQIFMCHTFSFLPLEGLLITLLHVHCQCLSLGQETGSGDRRPRT